MENLKIDDRVLVIGAVQQDVVMLPHETDIYLTRQANVIAVVEDE